MTILQFHGRGILSSPEGVYEGQFDAGLRQGVGAMRYKDESVFEGQWRDDRWHGMGTDSRSQAQG